MSYWFCLQHMDVEPQEGCAHAERLGPYATFADATHALARAKARTQAWDDDDERWKDHPWDRDAED